MAFANQAPGHRLLAMAVALWMGAGPARAAEGPQFDIYEYRVEGNSLLDAQAIERAVAPHMGEGQTLSAVEAARAALERRYHDAGYLTVLVSIPEQAVESGVVALQVTEAPVGKVKVAGSQYHLPSTIRQSVSEVAEGKVPNFNELQRQLAGVNRSADLKVAPVLKAGKVPGTVEVQLDVDDQLPLHGSIELNNKQSPNTSATRLSAAMRYDNLWQRGHSFNAMVQVSPQNLDETRLAVLNYMWPVGTSGEAMTAYLVSSRSKFATLFNAPGMGVLGNTDILGLRYSLPLDSDARYNQALTLGADYKGIRQALVLSQQASTTPSVHYVPLSLSYRGTWLSQGRPSSILDVSAVLGMRGLLGNADREFSAKEPGASANFMAWRTGLQINQDWGRWALSGKLELQLASGTLLPSERYVAGGADSVRGYLEGERAADTALRLSWELSSPTVKLDPARGDWRLQGLAFVDAASLRNVNPAVGDESRHDLAGVGFGLRLEGPRGVGVQIDAARAMVDGDVAGGGSRAGDWRVHGRLTAEF